MARIPYIKEDEHPELAATIAGIRARRHGDLSPVARMLLHSPELAEGWMKMFTVIRYQTTFPAKLRELIVARVRHEKRHVELPQAREQRGLACVCRPEHSEENVVQYECAQRRDREHAVPDKQTTGTHEHTHLHTRQEYQHTPLR